MRFMKNEEDIEAHLEDVKMLEDESANWAKEYFTTGEELNVAEEAKNWANDLVKTKGILIYICYTFMFSCLSLQMMTSILHSGINSKTK